MPVTKSAIKKLRQDRNKKQLNDVFRSKLEVAFKKVEKTQNLKLLSEAISLLDKSVKKNLLHENKSNRLKSKLAKLFSQKQIKTAPSAVKKLQKVKKTALHEASVTKRTKSVTQANT